MMVTRDMNMAAPHKGGNQYARICPNCGTRKFTTKRYWQTHEEPYVIPNGESDPVRLFECPYPECDADIHEGMDECEACGGELEWVDEEEDEDGEETTTDDDEAEVADA